ncbi:MAG: hypothetical protein JSU03_00540 [Bacteroidetes bacterium]|nr:hypothetical protein [Bacteroidota bacterium]MBS1755739.1 hypothetical protein [Bacteroidota bacterium]
MKKNITLFIAIALLSMNCYAASLFQKIVAPQQRSFNELVNKTDSVPVNDYKYYLQKSKNQKKAAFVLLGGGTGLILIGLAVGDRKKSSFGEAASGGVIAIVGILGAIGSIPLFVASAHNKKVASLSIKNQQVYNYLNQNNSRSITAVCLRIPFGK